MSAFLRTRTLGRTAPKKILIIFDYVKVFFVLKSFINSLLYVKSITSVDPHCANYSILHIQQYWQALGLNYRITTSEARFSSLSNTPLTAPKNDRFE